MVNFDQVYYTIISYRQHLTVTVISKAALVRDTWSHGPVFWLSRYTARMLYFQTRSLGNTKMMDCSVTFQSIMEVPFSWSETHRARRHW